MSHNGSAPPWAAHNHYANARGSVPPPASSVPAASGYSSSPSAQYPPGFTGSFIGQPSFQGHSYPTPGFGPTPSFQPYPAAMMGLAIGSGGPDDAGRSGSAGPDPRSHAPSHSHGPAANAPRQLPQQQLAQLDPDQSATPPVALPSIDVDSVVQQLLLHQVPIAQICSKVSPNTVFRVISRDERLHPRLPELEQYLREQMHLAHHHQQHQQHHAGTPHLSSSTAPAAAAAAASHARPPQPHLSSKLANPPGNAAGSTGPAGHQWHASNARPAAGQTGAPASTISKPASNAASTSSPAAGSTQASAAVAAGSGVAKAPKAGKGAHGTGLKASPAPPALKIPTSPKRAGTTAAATASVPNSVATTGPEAAPATSTAGAPPFVATGAAVTLPAKRQAPATAAADGKGNVDRKETETGAPASIPIRSAGEAPTSPPPVHRLNRKQRRKHLNRAKQMEGASASASASTSASTSAAASAGASAAASPAPKALAGPDLTNLKVAAAAAATPAAVRPVFARPASVSMPATPQSVPWQQNAGTFKYVAKTPLPPLANGPSRLVLDISDSEEDADHCHRINAMTTELSVNALPAAPARNVVSSSSAADSPMRSESPTPSATGSTASKAEKRKAPLEEGELDISAMQAQLVEDETAMGKAEAAVAEFTAQAEAQKAEVARLRDALDRAKVEHDAANGKLTEHLRDMTRSALQRATINKRLVLTRQNIAAAEAAERVKRAKREAEHQALREKYARLLKQRELLLKPKPPPLAVKMQAALIALKDVGTARPTPPQLAPSPAQTTLEQCVLIDGEWVPPNLLLLPSDLRGVEGLMLQPPAAAAGGSKDPQATGRKAQPTVTGVLMNDRPLAGSSADVLGLAQSSSNWTFKPHSPPTMVVRALTSINLDASESTKLRSSTPSTPKASTPFSACSPSLLANDARPSTPRAAAASLAASLTSTPTASATASAAFLPAAAASPRIPDVTLCPFESAGGTCNDPACSFTHFRELGSGQAPELLLVKKVRNTLTVAVDPKTLMSELKKALEECATDADVVDKVSALCDRASVALEARAPRALVEFVPTTVSGVHRLVASASSFAPAAERYWEARLDDAELEQRVKAEPQREDNWLQYALMQLPPSLSEYDLNSAECTSLHACLNVLQRGLQQLPKSAALWDLYLDLLPRKERNLANVKKAMDAAVEHCPTHWGAWWKYLRWARTLRTHAPILIRMFSTVVRPLPGSMGPADREARSHLVLDVLLNVCLCIQETLGAHSAAAFLAAVLCAEDADSMVSGAIFTRASQPVSPGTGAPPTVIPADLNSTVCAALMDSTHLAFAWCALLYAQVHEKLPEDMFYNMPHDYLVRAVPFVVCAPPKAPLSDGIIAPTTSPGCAPDLLRAWANMVRDHGRGRSELGVMVLHVCNLGNFDLSKLGDAVTLLPAHLRAFVSSNAEEEGPQGPLYWNVSGKRIFSTASTIDEKRSELIKELVNGIRCLFQGLDRLSTVTADDLNQAMQLYRHMCHFPYQLPDAMQLRPTKFATSRSPVLWLNLTLLQQLCSDHEHALSPAKCFGEALLALPHDSMLWKEYLRWSQEHSSSGKLTALALRAVAATDGDVKHEYAASWCNIKFFEPVDPQDHQMAQWVMDNVVLALPPTAAVMAVVRLMSQEAVHDSTVLRQCARTLFYQAFPRSAHDTTLAMTLLRMLQLHIRDASIWDEVLSYPWNEHARQVLQEGKAKWVVDSQATSEAAEKK